MPCAWLRQRCADERAVLLSGAVSAGPVHQGRRGGVHRPGTWRWGSWCRITSHMSASETLAGAARGCGCSLAPMLMTCGGVCVLRGRLWIFIPLPPAARTFHRAGEYIRPAGCSPAYCSFFTICKEAGCADASVRWAMRPRSAAAKKKPARTDGVCAFPQQAKAQGLWPLVRRARRGVILNEKGGHHPFLAAFAAWLALCCAKMHGFATASFFPRTFLLPLYLFRQS